MALAVCLLLDERGEGLVRGLWARLEHDGVATLQTHTHGRHVPHLTYASLRTYDEDRVADALGALPEAAPLALHVDALGVFRRSRCWLAQAVHPGLAERQARVVTATVGTGADLHRHYVPGAWVPHLTLAPRLHLSDLPVVAAAVFDVLPLDLAATRSVLIDTSTGRRHPLPHLV
jgi:2'-5' RNA ligase